ncbi:MAG: C40 family peptidase [Verrucomicrobiae bacterium]|nr:C40 family peptidase [Verrucomicrobiae bacterium]
MAPKFMKKPNNKTSSARLLVFGLILSWQVGFAVSPAVAEGNRFTMLGWVKQKLSPGDQARATSQIQTVRPPVMPQPAPTMGQMAASSSQMGQGLAPVPSRPPMNPQTVAAMGMAPQPQPQMLVPRAPGPRGPATVDELRHRAEFLATRGLTYKFGADHPSEGGMDCSGTMQFLLKSIGYTDIPRTSYNQYEWLEQKGTLRKVGFFRSPERAISDFRPGDLIFWGGTYDSGHKVSHVMVYLGRSRSGTHYIFGARGKKVKGLNGNGVDIFEYKPSSTGGRLVGYGRLPGLK